MKPIVIYNMEKTRIGSWIMEWYPAKYHYPFILMTGQKVNASETLLKHELIHHYQVQRDGWFKFTYRYYTQLWTVGYRMIDYEIEAYARMHEPLTLAERELLNLGAPRRFEWLPR